MLNPRATFVLAMAVAGWIMGGLHYGSLPF
jgi:hypothetical protein